MAYIEGDDECDCGCEHMVCDDADDCDCICSVMYVDWLCGCGEEP